MIHSVILNLFNLYCYRQIFMSFVPIKCLDDKYEIYKLRRCPTLVLAFITLTVNHHPKVTRHQHRIFSS